MNGFSVCIRDAKEAFSVRPRFPDHFTYMVLDVEDSEEQNLIRLFPRWDMLPAVLYFRGAFLFPPWLPVNIRKVTLDSFFILPKCNPARNNSLMTRSHRVEGCWYIAMVWLFPSYYWIPVSRTCSQSRFCVSGGISLSPAFVVMYVMQFYKLSWEDALHLVQNRRYCISPNGGFLTQIKVCNFFLCFPFKFRFLMPTDPTCRGFSGIRVDIQGKSRDRGVPSDAGS